MIRMPLKLLVLVQMMGTGVISMTLTTMMGRVACRASHSLDHRIQSSTKMVTWVVTPNMRVLVFIRMPTLTPSTVTSLGEIRRGERREAVRKTRWRAGVK